MNPVLRNFLAVLAGLVVGSFANMALINLGPVLILPPANADITTMEGLKASIELFEPKHFLFPFLAHAIGTFVGSFLAYNIATSKKIFFAYLIGILFLAGGIANCVLLPSPMWFNIIDLVFAYLPMAFLATTISGKANLERM